MSLRTGMMLCMALAMAGCAGEPGQTDSSATNATGIEDLTVELTAGGDMVRLNYRVMDVERARLTLKGDVFLRDGEEGTWLKVPSAGRLGQMRQRPSSGHKRQFILFTNPGRSLVRGDIAILYVGTTPIARVPVT